MDDKQKEQQKINRNLNPQATPILYTDDVFMTISNQGVVLDIGQRIANTNQIQVISRIGMSREHAKELVKQLGNLLAMTDGQLQTGVKEKN